MSLRYLCIVLIFHLASKINPMHCRAVEDQLTSNEVFIIRYFEEGKIIPIKIELNYAQQTEQVQILISNSSWFSISLHDFNEKKIAHKDVNSSQCFIVNALQETFLNDKKKLQELKNGVIKGFYIPTFFVLKELDNTTDQSQKLGKHISSFCNGSSISYASREPNQLSRKKRQITSDPNDGKKGQFTHHSYGHYGHQSNNYAHYGHETHITGTIDKGGSINDGRITQYQERSQSSQSYPATVSRNVQQSPAINGRISSKPQYLRNSSPATEITGNNRQNFSQGSAGQFSLQTTQESGYQLNLPLGLNAGNSYRGGTSSSGQYGVGGSHPYLYTDQKTFPSDAVEQRYPNLSAPTLTQSQYPRSFDGSKIDDSTQKHSLGGKPSSQVSPISTPGVFQTHPVGIMTQTTGTSPSITPFSGIAENTRISGQPTSHQPTQNEFIHSRGGQIKPSISEHIPQLYPEQNGYRLESDYRPHVQSRPVTGGFQTDIQPQSALTNDQIGLKTDFSEERYPQSRVPILQHGLPVTGYQQSTIPVSSTLSQTFEPPSYTTMQKLQPAFQTVSTKQKHEEPSQTISGYQPRVTQTLNTGGIDSKTNGLLYQSPDHRPRNVISNDLKTPVIISQTPGIYTSQPGLIDGRTIQQRYVPSVGSHLYPGQVTQNGQVSRTIYNPQDSVQFRQDRIPMDRVSDTIMPPGSSSVYALPTALGTDLDHFSRPQILDSSDHSFPVQSPDEVATLTRTGGTYPGTGVAGIRTRGAQGAGRDTLAVIRGDDSASSQTQIQTGLEGTAAEASAAGKFRGLGSQTQVQGGYAGNGSFSAQAQSGFNGGITQSQIQGGRQGGLSGSSATVENVGSVQSQVQIGKPSGSASSTAQGRFSGGMTNVRAQSGRTGGSAGAESQSRGLSSSQVQVNIAGEKAEENTDFQGIVSASVLGGHSSGQSQTQLQGGYNSGRTYAATAQGGFDALADYQRSIPESGSVSVIQSGGISSLPSQSLDRYGNIRQTSQTVDSTALLYPPGSQLRSSPTSEVRGISEPYDIASQHSSSLQLGSLRDNIPVPDGSSRQISYPTETRPSVGSHRQSDLSNIPIITSRPSLSHDSQTSETRQINGQSKPFPGSPLQTWSLPQTPNIIERQRPDYTQLPASQKVPSGTSDVSGHPSILQPPPRYYPQTPTDISSLSPQITSIPRQSPQQTRVHLPISTQYEQRGGITHMRPQSGFIAPDAVSKHSQTSPHFPTTNIGQHPGKDHSQTGQPGYTGTPLDAQQHIFVPGQFLPSSYQPSFRPIGEVGQASPQIIDKMLPIGVQQPMFQPSSHTQGLRPVNGVSQAFPQTHDGIVPVSFHKPEYQPSQVQPSSQLPGIRPDLATSGVGSQTSPSTTDRITPSFHQPVIQSGQVQPSAHFPSPSGPNIRQVSPSRTVTSTAIGSTLGSSVQKPGPYEPDPTSEKGCCEALKNLKQRCCGRSSKKQGGSCCTSAAKDVIADFEDDDLSDENNKEPCKVVKAICYIVYKPVGKARICKPTNTNDC